jgi:hypothetical protein
VSKGSRQRPLNREKFRNNFDKIKWGKPKWKPAKKQLRKRVHYIMPDIEPYKAVGGEEAKRGEWITSRSREREYLHKNGFEQVGNEKEYFFKYNGKSHDNPTKDWGRE